MKPKVCILRADGINCDEETFFAFKKYGAEPKFVHVNELRDKSKNLRDFKILAIPIIVILRYCQTTSCHNIANRAFTAKNADLFPEIAPAHTKS